MPDKLVKNDSRRMWERVLSSIPHGVKVETISTTSDRDKKAAETAKGSEPPTESVTPRPSGPE